MKNKLLIAFLLIGTIVTAQSVPRYSTVSGNYRYPYFISVDGALHAPAGPTPTLVSGAWARSGALFVDSSGGGTGLYYYRFGVGWIRLFDTTNSVVAAPGWGQTISHDSVYAGGLGNGTIGYYIRNNYNTGAKSGQVRFSNRLTNDSLFQGASTTTLNAPLSNTDATYGGAIIAVNAEYREGWNDTANLQYSAPIAVTKRRGYDSTTTRFGPSATKKPIILNGGGFESTNQFFPPRDSTSVYSDIDGRTSASFSSLYGLGTTWGYNINVYSAYPQFPLVAGFNSVLDLQREASRTRVRKITGNGIVGYLGSWKSWQQAITSSNTNVGHYVQLVGDFMSYGSTDYNLLGSGADKAKILAVSTVDTAYGFLSKAKYTAGNEVNVGVGFWQQGSSDLNFLEGKTWLKQAGWFNSSNTVDFNTPGAVNISTKDSTQYIYLGNYGNTATLSVRGKYFNGGNTGGIDMEINRDINSTAALRINFYKSAGDYNLQYHLGKKKFWASVEDSVSFQAPAYKFGGLPRTTTGTWLMAYDSASQYAGFIRSDGLGLSGGGGGSYSAGYGLSLASTTFSLDTTVAVNKANTQVIAGSKILTGKTYITGNSGTTTGLFFTDAPGTQATGNISRDGGTGGLLFQSSTSDLSFSSASFFDAYTASGQPIKLRPQGGAGVMIGATGFTPTALLHVAAGTTSLPSFKVTTGTLTTTAQAGAQEYNGNWYQSKSNDVRYGVGGTLKSVYADVGNVGGGEDDLMTYSVPAGTLAADGDYIEFEMNVQFTTANSKTLKVYFGSSQILSTGPSGTAVAFITVKGTVIRTGATTQRANVQVVTSSATYNSTSEYATPNQTLSGAVTLKATGTGVADNDIVQHFLTVKYFPSN